MFVDIYTLKTYTQVCMYLLSQTNRGLHTVFQTSRTKDTALSAT